MDGGIPDDRECVSVRTTAEILQCGRSTVYELLRAGKLKSVKIGRLRRVTLKSIRKLAQTGS